jgi:chitin disaccharide deacetylase
MSAPRLIVNADDLGISPGVTDGILFAHRHGAVTSTSMMANQPSSEYAAQQLGSVPNLGVGVHLTLDQGRPVLPANQVPSLVNADGDFLSNGELRARLWRRKINSHEIEAEFRTQIQWLKARGIHPSHADSHRHIHFYPYVARAFYRACRKEQISRVRVPRIRHYPRSGYIGGPHAGAIHRRLLVTLYMEFLMRVRFHSLQRADCRVEANPRYDDQDLSAGWRLALENLPAGTYEFVCHPGFAESYRIPQEFPGFARRRELELGILTDQTFLGLIQRKQIQLISFNQL